MNKLVAAFIEENEINASSISFFCDVVDGELVESPDVEFGTCDVSGKRGSVVNCVAQLENGDLYNFQANLSIVGTLVTGRF